MTTPLTSTVYQCTLDQELLDLAIHVARELGCKGDVFVAPRSGDPPLRGLVLVGTIKDYGGEPRTVYAKPHPSDRATAALRRVHPDDLDWSPPGCRPKRRRKTGFAVIYAGKRDLSLSIKNLTPGSVLRVCESHRQAHRAFDYKTGLAAAEEIVLLDEAAARA